MCTADLFVEQPVKLYDSTNPDWVPHLRMGYEVEAPDQVRYASSELRKKRKMEYASGEHEVDLPIADKGKVDAVCQTDDGWINDLKVSTIQNLRRVEKFTK